MYKIIITEKPSVAREYAKVLQINQDASTDGYIEGKSEKTGQNYRITWSIGHLITLSYPEVYDQALKKWSMDTLPFLPEVYRYEVIPDVKKQYGVVKKLYHAKDIDTIYYAGDSGREGIYIQMLIRMMAGHTDGVEEKVVWIDSQTETAILNGIRDAKPLNTYNDLIDSAYMRGIEDYAVGINFSRALSCKFGYSYNKALSGDQYKPISVGRVMTCVLGMIVNREREIQNFRETIFYKSTAACQAFNATWKAVEGTLYFNSPEVYNNTGFLSAEKAGAFVAMLKQQPDLTVVRAEAKTEKKYAPLLYNLAEIQNDCTKTFKISPAETLDVIQTLYEQKLVTYPRTDARVLSTAVCGEIGKTLNGLAALGCETDVVAHILETKAYKGLEKTRYCDDSKITDHYAIIPTGEGNPSALKDLQGKVYSMIVKRFLSVFYPAAEYKKMEVELEHVSGEHFFVSEKILKSSGYLEVLENTEIKEDTALMQVKKGDKIRADYSVSEGRTTPPKRYTSGSMILAMENAGSLIEEEELREQIKSCGIGTSATRAGILTKLVRNGYIALNKKTQCLAPQEAGEKLYDIVNDNIPALLSPKMTASWEKGLVQIEEGKTDKDVYLHKLNDYITKEVDKIKAKEPPDQFAEEEVGICPFCGGLIVTSMNGFRCQNYSKDEDGCPFYVSQIAGKKISKNILLELLHDGKTEVLDGFKGKTGKTFSASLELDMEEKGIRFAFPEIEQETVGICPYCGADVVTARNGFKCENYGKEEGDCNFYVGTIAGKKISKQELQMLLKERRTNVIKGFKGKTGKSFSAALVLDTEEKCLKFDFPESSSEETEFECIKCGNKLKKDKYNLRCNCGFKIPHTVAKKKLSKNDIVSLLAGRTGLINGFTSKKGKKFSAVLVLNDNDEVEFYFPDSN